MVRFAADFILGRFFFVHNSSQVPQRCFITGSRYCNLLQLYVIRALRHRQCLQTTVFMQDGVLPHIAPQIIALLQAHFGDGRVISRGFQTA